MNVVTVWFVIICVVEAAVMVWLAWELRATRDLVDDYSDICDKALDFADEVLKGKEHFVEFVLDYMQKTGGNK